MISSIAQPEIFEKLLFANFDILISILPFYFSTVGRSLTLPIIICPARRGVEEAPREPLRTF